MRPTISLRRVDDLWLGSFGLRIVKIEKLRANKIDALADGQSYFLAEIEKLQGQIEQFEIEKDVKA